MRDSQKAEHLTTERMRCTGCDTAGQVVWETASGTRRLYAMDAGLLLMDNGGDAGPAIFCAACRRPVAAQNPMAT